MIISDRYYDRLDKLYCLNRNTGKLVWVKIFTSEFIVPYSFPISDNKLIFINDIASKKVYALNITTGNKIWSADVPAKQDPDHRMILQSNNLICYGNVSSPPNSRISVIFTLNKNTGTLLARQDLQENIESLCADETRIYADHGVSCSGRSILTPNVFWNLEFPDKRLQDSIPTGLNLSSNSAKTVSFEKYFIKWNFLSQGGKCLYNSMNFFDKATGSLAKSVDFSSDCGLKP